MKKSFKILAQLSHFITMLFGIALGLTLSILYQHYLGLFLVALTPIIVILVLMSICLRAYSVFLWKNGNYDSYFVNKDL
jgi:hypothetical protein|tara:strand:+ start:3707 stop:3943 length:237 start_codon:yes stop_codon:yes gene_type:complete